MLQKRRRLTSAEVREVLKKGRTRRAQYIMMKFLATGEGLKMSVVVAKSVAKKAVERNRLRRSVYGVLTPLSGTGRAVIFVQKIPQADLSRAFAEDVVTLFKNSLT